MSFPSECTLFISPRSPPPSPPPPPPPPSLLPQVTGLDPEQEYMFRVRAHNESGTSEPTLPATLERPKKKAATPQRRGSSVERRSLDRRSGDRMSERRSLSRTSLDRRSESRLSRREGGKKDGEDLDTLPGMSPEDSRKSGVFGARMFCLCVYVLFSHLVVDQCVSKCLVCVCMCCFRI